MTSSRRQLLQGVLALGTVNLLAKTFSRFRLAICNETFQALPFAKMCRTAKRIGYQGIEIAPFTLSEDPASIPPARRVELRDVMVSEGLDFVGLHALLSTPKWLHVTTPDKAIWRRSWEYVRKLIELCSNLGDRGIMVFGSGKQRSTMGDSSVSDAVARLKDGLVEVATTAEAEGVTILIETLAPHLSDIVTSLDEAVSLVNQIGSPAVQTMFDIHNAVGERIPHAELIQKHYRYIRHVHINEIDGRHPGTGSYDYRPVLQALKDLSYDRWLSLEVFQFSVGGERMALDSLRFLQQLESELK